MTTATFFEFQSQSGAIRGGRQARRSDDPFASFNPSLVRLEGAKTAQHERRANFRFNPSLVRLEAATAKRSAICSATLFQSQSGAIRGFRNSPTPSQRCPWFQSQSGAIRGCLESCAQRSKSGFNPSLVRLEGPTGMRRTCP